MNTEAMNTLKQVREGIKSVQLALSDDTLTKGERRLLGEVLINLNDLEDIIINQMLQDMVDQINSTNDQLKELIEKMKASTEKLAAFSETIKKISTVVGVLAEITGKALSAGIL